MLGNQRGQGLAAYAIILAFVVVALVASVESYRNALIQSFQDSVNALFP